MSSPAVFMRPLLAVALLVVGGASLRADFAADLARVSVEAAGGVAAHERLSGLRAIGVTRVGEREVRFILYARRPNLLRIESLGDKGSFVQAFDGVHAPWEKSGPLSPPRRMGRAEEEDFLFDADFDSPLHDFARRGISLDYAGEAVVDGRGMQKLLAVQRHTDLTTLYIDDETKLLVRRDRAKTVDGREAVFETRFSDFRPVAGLLLPYRVATLVEGKVMTEVRIEEIDANPELPAGFFSPPAADWPRR